MRLAAEAASVLTQEDVARRAATDDFLALAPDGLSPVRGYTGDDDGGTLQVGLDEGKLRTGMVTPSSGRRWEPPRRPTCS